MLFYLTNPTPKYLITTLSIWISLFLSFELTRAQTRKDLPYLYQEKLQKANELYEISNFKNAIEIYKEIVEKTGNDTAILCKIADSYRLLNDSKNAEEWYRKAIVENEAAINPVYKLYFAQVLTTNRKYEEAKYWFGEYNKTVTSDARALEGIKSIENLSKLYYDTMFYIVYPLSLNTKYSELAPCFYKNGLVFLSDRNTTFYKEKNAMTNTGFMTLYFSVVDSDGNCSKPTKFTKEIESKYHEGPVAFFDNERKIIFTSNHDAGKKDKDKVNVINLQLFSASHDTSREWRNIQLLTFNDVNYSFAQPSISNEGKTLYFSSNMPGGYGGADLYTSTYENESWQPPVNLGNKINTASDEMFPFIFNDSVLYFSSNGHGGLGGMDIFKSNLITGGSIENLGAPINSEKDDFGIIVDKDGLSGYLSSTRSGSGADDIYGFKLVRITLTIKIIDGTTALPLANAEIYSADPLNENRLGITDNDGSCTLIVPVCKSYQIKVKKENYETKIYTFESVKVVLNTLAVIPMETHVQEEEKIILTDENNNPVDPQKVVYKVQIFASRIPATKKELKRKYRGDLKINNFYEDRWYKYSIGEYKSYAEARQTCLNSKVYDAFIIAYIDNKKVHITIAKSTSNETNIQSPIYRIKVNR